MDTVTLTIRIDTELKKQIEELARNDNRSINNLINVILMKYVREVQEQDGRQ